MHRVCVCCKGVFQVDEGYFFKVVPQGAKKGQRDFVFVCDWCDDLKRISERKGGAFRQSHVDSWGWPK